MENLTLQSMLYVIILVLLAWPLGKLMWLIMEGKRTFLSPVFQPVEKLIYKVSGIDPDEEMNWKQYLVAVLLFGAVCFVVVFLLQLLQGLLPLNPQKLGGTSWHLALNTAVSFVTNTNWQSYSGESTMSYLTQMLGLTVQNFVSAAVGLAVLFALIRGFTRTLTKTIGNFWTDLVRGTVYILLPLAFALAIVLVSQGAIQNFSSYKQVDVLQSFTANGQAVATQTLPMGPAASQVAIKQLGTNGGGFFGVNSAHPFENPTPFSNLLEMLSILLLPFACCFTFGYAVRDRRQGRALLAAMLVVFVVCIGFMLYFEQAGTAQLAAKGAVDISTTGQSGGNMEGKETRFGVTDSALWAVSTTAASNGSVNAMHDSFTPMGGLIAMLMMQLGEVIGGGIGSGLYGMIAFAIMAVFIAGLMVGRTPEYLGKKIEPYEMRMAVLTILVPPVVVLAGAALACVVPGASAALNNTGAHGFSEILYAYSSAGNNNGSAFAGLGTNTVFYNVTLAIAMVLARYVPIGATLGIAGSLAGKKQIPASAGTLATHNLLFIGLLVAVVLIIGALSFFPSLALGPIAEQLSNLH
jgi:potassium-transporting ATPase potassium-binding subunit